MTSFRQLLGRFLGRQDRDNHPTDRTSLWLAEAQAEYEAKRATFATLCPPASMREHGFDQDTGRFHVHLADQRTLHATGSILATYRLSDHNWEWAWNNPQIPTNQIQASKLVQAKGAELGMKYCLIGQLPLKRPEDVHFFCAVGLKASGFDAIFPLRAEDIMAFILLEDLTMSRNAG